MADRRPTYEQYEVLGLVVVVAHLQPLQDLAVRIASPELGVCTNIVK